MIHGLEYREEHFRITHTREGLLTLKHVWGLLVSTQMIAK